MQHLIGIIGAGNMGGAIYKSLAGEFGEDSIIVVDRDLGKLKSLGCKNYAEDANEIIDRVDLVILAIKPQVFLGFVGSLDESVREILGGKIVISIMAGISLDGLAEATGAEKIVRSMPNLPIQVKKGIVGWIGNEAIDDEDRELIKKIFSSMGQEIELNNEEMIDAITAASGSGPAYFFYLTEILTNKVEELGFSYEEARKIAENTFIGSAFLLDQNDMSAKEWKEAVTSKGGTTEAALKYLEENKFNEIFAQGIEQARSKSKSIAPTSSPPP